MTTEAQYTFDLDADHLDALRTHLMAAERYHAERATYFRGLRTATELANAITETENQAKQARFLWSLLAGVREARCKGSTPVGHVHADELRRFLRI